MLGCYKARLYSFRLLACTTGTIELSGFTTLFGIFLKTNIEISYVDLGIPLYHGWMYFDLALVHAPLRGHMERTCEKNWHTYC